MHGRKGGRIIAAGSVAHPEPRPEQSKGGFRRVGNSIVGCPILVAFFADRVGDFGFRSGDFDSGLYRWMCGLRLVP